MTADHAEKSLLRGNSTSNATAQQLPQKSATTHATSTQQDTLKPASLLDIARNKLRNSHATSSQNSTQQAPQKTSKGVAQETTSWRWLLHCPDREIVIWTIPESSLAQVLKDFPTATRAEPIPDTPKRMATYPETRELTALVNLIYASDTDTDQAEALAAALADPDDALAYYRAMRDTLQTRTAALSLPGNVHYTTRHLQTQPSAS